MQGQGIDARHGVVHLLARGWGRTVVGSELTKQVDLGEGGAERKWGTIDKLELEKRVKSYQNTREHCLYAYIRYNGYRNDADRVSGC